MSTSRADLGDALLQRVVEDGPRSASQLAREAGVRKSDVLAALHGSHYLTQVSSGARTVWALTGAGKPSGTGREPLQGDGSVDPMLVIDDRIAAIERRLDALEDRNGTRSW